AAIRRLMAGWLLDGHRFSGGLLPPLSSLCDIFSSLGLVALEQSGSPRGFGRPPRGGDENGPNLGKGVRMRFPVHIMTDTIQHQVRNAIQGRKRYPFVLMLEPLYTCNLACIGCAVERHTGKLKDRLSVDKCLEAVEVSQAPVVSICGGEPTIYPELPELVEKII